MLLTHMFFFLSLSLYIRWWLFIFSIVQRIQILYWWIIFYANIFFSIKLSLIISVAIISILLILIGIIILIKYLRQRIIDSSIKVNIQSILYLDTIHILFYV